MAGEWTTGTLGDIADLVMGQSPTGDTCNEVGRGFPLLNGPTEFGGDHPRPVQFTTDPRKFAEPGDLLFCVRGSTTGRMNWADQRYAIGRGLAAIRAKKGVEIRHFVRAVIDANLPRLLASATGSTFPNVSRDQIQAIECVIPPLSEQRAIAAVLGALDDKIELTRRMNATLEATARALFQSWFVDFDPVRAKQEGRKPTGMDDATAALFPDSFQESETGHIPKGWEVKTLSDLTSLITKGTTPTQDDMTGAPDSDAQINYVRVNSIDEEGSVLGDKLTKIPESVHEGFLKRSILMANDVLYTIAGTIGRIALAEDWLLPANTNQAVAIIRPEPEIPSGFLMLTMRHEVFREELHNNIVHAVQANLSLGMLSKARVVIPPQSILQQLFRPIDTLLSQISANRAQSRTLATLRDTLLPKLLSGELRVSDAERAVSSVA